MPFQYSQYRSPLTDTIAARIANQGAIEAQLAQQSGNAWAGAVNNIGQAVAQIPGQIEQQKEHALRQQIGQQQVQQGAMALDQATQANDARSLFKDTLKNTPMVKEQGMDLYDIPSISQKLGAAGVDPATFAKPLSELNDSFRSFNSARQAVIVNGAQKVAAAGNDPDLALHFLEGIENNGVYSKDQIGQFKTLIQQGGQPAVEKLTAYLMGPQKGEVVPAGSTVLNPITQQPMYSAPEKPTEASIALDAAKGNPEAAKAMGMLKPPKPGPSVGSFEDYVTRKYGASPQPAQIEAARKAYGDAGRVTVKVGETNTDVADAVKGMKDGTLPPQLPGRASKEYVAIMAEAKRQGFDLAGAATDWQATQKHIATMNGAQQLRLNQAINSLPEMLDSVDALASKWKGGNFPILNKANLALAKGGAFGKDVASVANQLDAQIADVTADLGNVYMGGNSPTDHALGLAGKSLSAEWDEKVLHDMVALAKKNVVIRQNSIRNTGVAGASDNNPYAPSQNQPAGGQNVRADGMIEAIDPQGQIHHAPAGTPLPAGWKLK